MFGLQNDISLVVLAALLSLLPVVILFWIYYLREREPSVAGRIISRFFAAGVFTVLPAMLLESSTRALIGEASPAIASAFFAEFFAAHTLREYLLIFLIAFGVVAFVEEGLRFLILRFFFRQSAELDQVVDGLQVGIAAGIGFAFVENTLYFLRLLERLDFNTLAVVFFLRFLISTFGHITFSGIMGIELAQAIANPLNRRSHLWRAFLIPWATHGLFDVLLSVRLSAYTVFFLLLPLYYLWSLYHSPQLHEHFRLYGRMLRAPIRLRRFVPPWRRLPVDVLETVPWCPNCLAPISDLMSERCPLCGTAFHRKSVPSGVSVTPPSVPAT